MKIGWHKECISPSGTCTLAGYLKERKMQGIHDDLYVKAVVCSFQEETICLLSYDLIAIDHELRQRVIHGCKEAGLEYSQIMLCAIHTHSGPGGTLDTTHSPLRIASDVMGEINDAYLDEVSRKSVECVQKAMADMEEAELYTGNGKCKNVCSNRFNNDTQNSEDMWLMEIHTPNKKMMLVNYACHPTILHDDNERLSADYIGALATEIEKEGYDMMVFLNGACGDISTRFTRKDTGFAEVERIASCIAASIHEIQKHLKQVQLTSLHFETVPIEMRLKQPSSKKEALMRLEKAKQTLEQVRNQQATAQAIRVAESEVEGASIALRYASISEQPKTLTLEVTLVQWNDDAWWIFVPGELFSSLFVPIRKEKNHVICYANGYHLYFADRQAYHDHIYEAMCSPFMEGESEKVMEQIEATMKRRRL